MDKLGILGAEGYAVFLREEFKPATIILTAIGMSIIPTAILITYLHPACRYPGFNAYFQIFFVLNYVIFIYDNLALLALFVKEHMPGAVKWMGFLLAFGPVLNNQLMLIPQATALNVFLLCCSMCVRLLLLWMLTPDWTHPHITLAWKGIHLSFLHWNKGARQARHSGREQVDFDQ